MFANRYLENNRITPLVPESPSPRLVISIVIPCLNEPDIMQTLTTIAQCQTPLPNVEVLIIINQSEAAPAHIKNQNLKTKQELQCWITNNRIEKLDFHAVGPLELKKKWAGAGVARKKGMDEAIFRFNRLNRQEGVIVSLDADTLVEKNYLTAIEEHFNKHPEWTGATLAFKHQTSGLSEKHLQGILLYEKYMDYYKNALEFTGYPYPMFTVGSAFAVTAEAYVKRGGMNRRKAGEDFYFLQNLAQQGPVGEILTTTVHPSARVSDRVPFGTGPAMQKWLKGEEYLSITYSVKAFSDLKRLFDAKDLLFKTEKKACQYLHLKLPEPVTAFLEKDNFWQEIVALNANCASLPAFRKRFFHKFNAFKILKFLNFSHPAFYQKADLHKQVSELSVLMNK